MNEEFLDLVSKKLIPFLLLKRELNRRESCYEKIILTYSLEIPHEVSDKFT